MNPIITEVTTGATDAILGLEAVLCAAFIWSFLDADAFKVRVWLGVFGLLTIASALGAVAHGLDLSDGLRDALWQPLFLSLGLMLGLIAVAAAHDRWGNAVGRKLLPIALLAGLGFYGVTVVLGGAFLIFVAYEAVAMIFALVVYLQLAGRGHPGASLVAAGIAVTLVAAVVQQTDWTVMIVWPLDHNGLFHLVQMPGLVLMTLGIRSSLSEMAAS